LNGENSKDGNWCILSESWGKKAFKKEKQRAVYDLPKSMFK